MTRPDARTQSRAEIANTVLWARLLASTDRSDILTVFRNLRDACKNLELKAILAHNRDEEKEHAAMVLEWIRRNDGAFSKELKDYLFTTAPIAHG